MRNPGSPFAGGSRMQFGPGGSITPVVMSLLVANVGLFLLSMVPGFDYGAFAGTFALFPNEVFAQGKVWQLLSYMFLHGSFMHLFFNMFMIWMFGVTVERAWGSQAFLMYYLVCGVGGGLAQWATGPGSNIPTVGASAAGLGVILAYALMFPDRKVLLYFLFPIKMRYFMWGLVVLELIAAFDGRKDFIAHFAHLGGMLFGWLYLRQDWRLGSFGKKARAKAARQKMAHNARRTEEQNLRRHELMQETNRILEKINREGMDSLTQEELRILREASGR